MTNKQLIKYAHIFALVALLAFGLLAVAGSAKINPRSQNSNQNQNQNQNANTNANQNTNANTNQNANTGGTGSQTALRNLRSQDRNFVRDAAMAGMAEVELGRLAVERGASDAVKQFGQRMVDDHTTANTQLMSILSTKGITLPTTLDRQHQQHVTRLSGLTGAEFDRAYSRLMVTEHNKAVNLFERESTRGADADLKAFATNTLPTLQEHLQMARALPGNARGGNDNTNSAGGRGTNRNMNSNRNMNGNTNRNSNGNTNRNNNGNNNGNSNRP